MSKRPTDPPESPSDPDAEPEGRDDEDGHAQRRRQISEDLRLEIDVLRDVLRNREEEDED